MDREGAPELGEFSDSPGEPFESTDEPVASDKPGTTAEEQRERSLERRLAMEEPDASPADRPAVGEPAPRPPLDDDIAPEDVAVEDPDVSAEVADLDRTKEEAGELSSDPAESAEEAAIHVEDE
jgi:hypothetical protein